MKKKDIMPKYRNTLQGGFSEVEKYAKTPGADQEKVRSANEQYQTLFRIIDALTPEEQEWPLDIDFERLHDIAKTVGATDQAVLLFIVNFHEYAKMIGNMARR
jgi:signal recognition particle GTPase